jgi:hypothetical protein
MEILFAEYAEYHLYIIRMCTERQQKMHLSDNPMPHQDMIEQSLLYYASRADISLLYVVFTGHPSLHGGAVINFIRK